MKVPATLLYLRSRSGSPDPCMALWCNWLTRRPLKAKSSGSSPDNATNLSRKSTDSDLRFGCREIQETVPSWRVGRARLNAPDSKSDIVARRSGVRIPHSPPPIDSVRRITDTPERSGVSLFGCVAQLDQGLVGFFLAAEGLAAGAASSAVVSGFGCWAGGVAVAGVTPTLMVA